ncbi:PAS domain-containing sensor histidine kinase [Membranicola marinus]|uniref:histidine kinase n=1 Tax=Membranihabitans marinus TaxID=1227546 RepID=A0A953L9L8_9BACT|nr:PAS domain-containing sensor histidine kinase [Membranihabitans marinus]MBY5958980.1 PAS domain-containing sensor histidine kinase [Membranihabitans marinus]
MLKKLIQSDVSNEHFKAFFEHAAIGIVVTTLTGEITAINPFALEKFGYDSTELIGGKIETLIPKRFHAKHVNYREDYSENPDSRPMGIGMDLFGARKDGTEFPVEVSLGHYVSQDGQYVIAYIADISRRKSVESEFEELHAELENTVEERTKELRRTEHLFLQLLKNYPDGVICIVDQHYRFVYTGGELHRQLNANIDELIGQEIFPFFPEGLRSVILSELSRVFIHKERITGLELPYTIAGGTYVLDSFPLIEGEDPIQYIGIIIKNITELKKAEQSLREDLRIEKDLNELKSRFVSMASHEFRTPLSTILSSAYLIGQYSSEADHPKRDRHLQRIISSVNTLTGILDDFLNLGKIEEGKVQPRFSDFNVEDLIKNTLDQIKHNLKKDQEINYQHDGDPMVFLDTSLLKHILMNLISNASKFSSEGAPIELVSSQTPNRIEISVRDYGIGVSPEDQEHLLERFYRGANAQNIQGTGLGLSIVNKYAEIMNGQVWFESELNQGTKFTVVFARSKE